MLKPAYSAEYVLITFYNHHDHWFSAVSMISESEHGVEHRIPFHNIGPWWSDDSTMASLGVCSPSRVWCQRPRRCQYPYMDWKPRVIQITDAVLFNGWIQFLVGHGYNLRRIVQHTCRQPHVGSSDFLYMRVESRMTHIRHAPASSASWNCFSSFRLHPPYESFDLRFWYGIIALSPIHCILKSIGIIVRRQSNYRKWLITALCISIHTHNNCSTWCTY